VKKSRKLSPMPSYPLPGAKPKQPIKSIDLDDVQKLVGEDPEQAVYHLDAAGSQSHRG
jgi:hypothetical protein